MENKKASSLSIFLVLISLVLTQCFISTKADLVGKVCLKTQDPHFCLKALTSYPDATAADLYTLAQIALSFATENATATSAKIQSLFALRTIDPNLKFHLFTCVHTYHDVQHDLQETIHDLLSHNYAHVIVMAEAAYNSAAKCEEEFNHLPSYPSPLSIDNRNVELLSEIVVVTGQMLLQNLKHY